MSQQTRAAGSPTKEPTVIIRRYWPVWALFCLVHWVGCHADAGGDGGSAAGASAAAAESAAKSFTVETFEVVERPVPKTITVTGTLEANQRTELAANASGRVVRTFVERGDVVKAGGLLAQLDARGAAISRDVAEANAQQVAEQLRAVQLECERYGILRDKEVITQQDYERQASQCATQASSEAAARARLADATRVLNDSAIRAPYAGVIAERFINVGDYVQPSSQVVTLLNDDPLRLQISVPEPAIPYAKEGAKVTFKTLAAPDLVIAATVKYVGREVRAQTRDLVVEAVVDNRFHKLLPGSFVTVQLPVGDVPQPIVPEDALVTMEGEDGDPTVFVVREGHAEQRAVHPLMSVQGGMAISEGLSKGERVVRNPSTELQNGSRVQ